MADISKHLEKAEKYLQKGKQDSALDAYLQALQEDPNNLGVLQNAADLSLNLNRTSEAARLLGALFDRQVAAGDGVRANVTYKKLARVTTPSVDQTFRYAQFSERSNKKEALESYQSVLDGFLAGGRQSDAMEALKRIVVMEPTAENYQRQGELAETTGDSKLAAVSFLRVGTLLAETNGDFLGWYERAHRTDPSNVEAVRVYAQSLLQKGDATAAQRILEPVAAFPDSPPEVRDLYARALLDCNRPAEAEPLIWEQVQRDPTQNPEVGRLVSAYLEAGQSDRALVAAQKLEVLEDKAGRRREFVSLMKEASEKYKPGIEFLEYLVAVYNSANREADYCATLTQLFELHYAAGSFLKAGDALDRAAEVDPYEEGHQKRLEMLRGKLEANRYNAIAQRFVSTGLAPTQENGEEAAPVEEPTVLEDFILQAEIFLQYSMRSKALERLERISKLFPYEEEKNEKLRQLYMNAGFVPRYEGTPPPAAPASAAGGPAEAAAGQAAAPAPAEGAIDNIARITEITRNIYRQANVKGVLFAVVNDVGRHFGASRCIAALITPGKPPSAALEYCAPGIKQSEVQAIVKMVQSLQTLVQSQGTVSLPAAQGAPELAALAPVLTALDIKSVLAVPLVDGEEHTGILILEQCGAQRHWRPSEVVVLKTIADQAVLAVNNARLRSLMKTLAVTDEKSGLLKRSSYLDVLLSETKRALQQNSPLSIMLLHFGKAGALVKEIGERGVEGLMEGIGQTLCSHIRQTDVAVRYELTTIALILADTPEKNCGFVVDKLRKVLATTRVPGTDRQVPVTVGIAEAVMQVKYDPIDIVTEVINRVDNALEAARAKGPNSVEIVAPSQPAAAVA